jgi:DNA-binding response OmpR family regulator
MRIVVIEDERNPARFIDQSPCVEGHAVTVCSDGESEHAAASTGDYALVVPNLTLPRPDGVGVLAGIRARLPESLVSVTSARRDRTASPRA